MNLSPAWLSLSASLTFISPHDNSRFFLFCYSRIKIAFFSSRSLSRSYVSLTEAHSSWSRVDQSLAKDDGYDVTLIAPATISGADIKNKGLPLAEHNMNITPRNILRL